MGAVHGLLFLLAVFLIQPLLAGMAPVRRWIFSLAVVLVFCDFMYTSYFNSFYMDAAALVACCVLLVLSKPQHAPLGVWLVALILLNGRVNRAFPICQHLTPNPSACQQFFGWVFFGWGRPSACGGLPGRLHGRAGAPPHHSAAHIALEYPRRDPPHGGVVSNDSLLAARQPTRRGQARRLPFTRSCADRASSVTATNQRGNSLAGRKSVQNRYKIGTNLTFIRA
jgi:hypothetical protein